jgi:hypothetical protein
LEGRWSRLAISAHTRGYLDFSKITRNNHKSIIREQLVLSQMEDDIYADIFHLKALVTAISVDDGGAATQANVGEYIDIRVPWIMAKKQEVTKGVSFPGLPRDEQEEAARLIAMYHKLQEEKNK